MNLKVRVKNPVFWVQIVLSILRLLKRRLLSHLVTEEVLTILEIL